MELLHTKQDFQQAQGGFIARKKAGVCLQLHKKFVERKQPSFSKSLIIPPIRDAQHFLCKPQILGGGRCQVCPSKVREMLEATSASPCFPTSAPPAFPSPDRAQGAVGRGCPCTPGSHRAPS